ncbi:MAG TPA: polyphosphate kinase 1 [Methanoregulaceae archaeon]|nr:polyphosphate kinase 1 [Methanoregulaceae archaeon]
MKQDLVNTSKMHYINRELSWIRFNQHVLDEAVDTRNPLLERLKFLSIFANNLDEFFMIRVSGLKRQVLSGVLEAPPDGMSPSEQLAAIHDELAPLLVTQSECLKNNLIPALCSEGIDICRYDLLSDEERRRLFEYFDKEIFPVLTPLAFDKSHPFPFISNLSLNLAIVVRDPTKKDELFARIKVPTDLFPRLILVPAIAKISKTEKLRLKYIFLEELIIAHLGSLFPGMEVVAAYPFRVTRDADFEIEEDEASDLLTAVEESVGLRRTGSPIRVEVSSSMPEGICGMLSSKLGVSPDMFYQVEPPVGMADLMQLYAIDRPDLKDPPFIPSTPSSFEGDADIFNAVKKRDTLLFHPYDSFSPVISFLKQAAGDPDVLAIKMTMYRVGPNSPIVAALMEARENGKVVAAIIELKARFDEENNIGWARALEQAGVHVVYGLAGLKVHAKICMVVRKEKDGIIRYLHLGTGNYNATTSRIYTDLGLFTSNQVIGADIADVFNTLTGYSALHSYRSLLVAPVSIRSGIIQRIEREIDRQKQHGDGHIIFKINALADRECIDALYRASQAGVKVDLQVRGICCLRPGIPKVSDRITVTSIVGRFLEHPRIFYFRNGGEEEVLLGSADLMPRNLDRRVEVLFPIDNPAIRRSVIDTILKVQLTDNVNARKLNADGSYERLKPAEGQEPCDSQAWFIGHRGLWHEKQKAGKKIPQKNKQTL